MARRRLSDAELQAVVARANRRCEYCQSWMDYSAQSFEVDHIIPIARGGRSDLSNLALSCGGCNSHKYTKTSAYDFVTSAFVPLFHPRQDPWQTHFRWSADYLQVLGLTPTGRATVRALQLNRSGNVNLRRLLRLAGLHPPAE